jgi:dihydroorotate dehydrogenase (NAD+) catalytic subunit
VAVSAPVAIGALRLPGPVLAAAGALGYGVAPVPGGSGEGGPTAPAVTAGITWRTRGGLPPRVVETPAGAVYSPGTAALGVGLALQRYARQWAARAAPVVVSLGGAAPEEYALAAGEIEGVAGVAALELDLTATDGERGLPFAHDPAEVRRILAGVRRACDLPLLIKLPADLPDPDAVLHAGAAGGAAGATIGAGLPAAVPAPAPQPPAGPTAAGAGLAGGAAVRGRLVGPATFPVVLDLVARLAPGSPLPVIACGGVAGPDQARAYLRAGAAAVQVGSAHLADPRAADEILRSLMLA